MMLLKIDINKWFSWLNLGIKDPSTASAVEVLLQIAVICPDCFFIYILSAQGNNPGDRGEWCVVRKPNGMIFFRGACFSENI